MLSTHQQERKFNSIGFHNFWPVCCHAVMLPFSKMSCHAVICQMVNLWKLFEYRGCAELFKGEDYLIIFVSIFRVGTLSNAGSIISEAPRIISYNCFINVLFLIIVNFAGPDISIIARFGLLDTSHLSVPKEVT